MAHHPLLDTLQLSPTTSLDQVERAFMDHVKARFQSVAESYDDSLVQQEEAYLRQIYPQFFDYTVLWVKDQLEKNRGEKNHPDAANLKREARQVLSSLQNAITAFAVCYMHINRFMTLVRDEIKREDMKGIGFVSSKNIKWTSDTGLMLGRNKKRKQEIDHLNKKFNEAIILLGPITVRQEDFENGINGLFSKDDAEKILRSIRAALRIADFGRANRAVKDIAKLPAKFTLDRKAAEAEQVALQKKAQGIVDFFAEHAETFSGEDGKLFLNASEVKIILDSQTVERRKIRAFVVKYNLPYMAYKLDGLGRLRDRLMVIGSPEGLMTLYRKLITGLASPLKSLEEVRSYEADVLGLIKHLQASQFQDIPKIYQTACQTVDEFRAARQEYREDLDILMAEPDAAEIAEQIAKA